MSAYRSEAEVRSGIRDQVGFRPEADGRSLCKAFGNPFLFNSHQSCVPGRIQSFVIISFD